MNAKLLADMYNRPAAPPVEEEIPLLQPADEGPAPDETSLLGILELLLKHPARLDELTRDEARQAQLIPQFLAIVLISFSLFAFGLVLLFNHADRRALPPFLAAHWTGGVGPAFSLWAAYVVGLVAASGVCLPSFYFFGLLAGVQASAVQVTGHIMKGKASTAVMLLGLLPIYVAVVLGMVVFAAPPAKLQLALYLGLALPFFAGLWGVWSIYRGFLALCRSLPGRTREQRTCFLRRLTLAWAATYSVVTPVMIWTLFHWFLARLGG